MAHRRQHDRLKKMLDDLNKRGVVHLEFERHIYTHQLQKAKKNSANTSKLEPMERWSPSMRARIALKLKVSIWRSIAPTIQRESSFSAGAVALRCYSRRAKGASSPAWYVLAALWQRAAACTVSSFAHYSVREALSVALSSHSHLLQRTQRSL